MEREWSEFCREQSVGQKNEKALLPWTAPSLPFLSLWIKRSILTWGLEQLAKVQGKILTAKDTTL